MQEDFLHYLWRFKKVPPSTMMTVQGQPLEIVDFGSYNHVSGPDFFNARIQVGDQLWAGNVEMHTKASSWYAHGHENDPNYQNVILHVVWEHDMDILRKDGSAIPTLVLKNYAPVGLLRGYHRLKSTQGKHFINCESDLSQVDEFTIDHWLERLYIERLQERSVMVEALLQQSKNDWEAVLFTLLMKGFGSKINGDVFFQLARRIDFSVIKKMQGNPFQIESLLLGLSGLLPNDELPDHYAIQLKKEYGYLTKKFNLVPEGLSKPEFFKLRPNNFPTIRLSQLADLYAQKPFLFRELMEAENARDLRQSLNCQTGPYWEDHYTFGKISKKSKKKLTPAFQDLLIINAVLPLKFCYARHRGISAEESVLKLAAELTPERNSIISKFAERGLSAQHAMGTQAALQLYRGYCQKNKCLQCAVGTSLLSEKM